MNLDGNVFYSPYSIVAAMSMCAAGAKNNTEKQLKQVLNYAHLSNDDVHNGNLLLQQHLNSLGDNVSLNVANKIFQRNTYNVRQEFLDLLKKFYNGDVQGLDFSKASESAKTINNWVEAQTNKKIQNLVPESAISELTQLILVNAIYFRGNWEIKFNKNMTQTESFYMQDRTEKNVEMMGLAGKKFNFLYEPAGLKASACRLPYACNQISMTILLPHDDQNVSDIESKLDADVLKTVLSFQNPIKLNVFVPKFKFEQQFEV
jgi:serpin B